MGQAINRLSARKVQTITEPGRHADGGGLYLAVDLSGARRWVMLYRMNGKRREMGIGPVLSVSLADAREAAEAARKLIAAGRDPIEARRATPPAERATPTFGQIATVYMADREEEWRNPIHRKQWKHTLEEHSAKLWAMPVSDITTDDVLAVLRPIWTEKAETASRLRGRIERILDAGKVAGHRAGENPARWAGHLALILPKPKKLTRGNHAALPYKALPAFVADLHRRPGTSASALELVILTAARSGEVRGMTWAEIDLKARVWTVPAERMKGKRVHRVPLTDRAIEILRERQAEGAEPGDLIFPGPQSGRAMSDMAFNALLKRMKQPDITTHGFRSSFRDWAGEETDFPREVIEAALAHLVGDETERAYRRGDALEKRRQLMTAWAGYLSGSTAG